MRIKVRPSIIHVEFIPGERIGFRRRHWDRLTAGYDLSGLVPAGPIEVFGRAIQRLYTIAPDLTVPVAEQPLNFVDPLVLVSMREEFDLSTNFLGRFLNVPSARVREWIAPTGRRMPLSLFVKLLECIDTANSSGFYNVHGANSADHFADALDAGTTRTNFVKLHGRPATVPTMKAGRRRPA